MIVWVRWVEGVVAVIVRIGVVQEGVVARAAEATVFGVIVHLRARWRAVRSLVAAALQGAPSAV